MDREERARKIAEFRTMLEKRVRETEIELEGLRALLEFANTVVLEEGFRRAEVALPPARAPPSPRPAEPEAGPETVLPPSAAEGGAAVPLRTVTGDLLANLYVREGSVRIVPGASREFNVNTPPFSSFFVDRVLAQMRRRDQEAAERGEIPPEQGLSYDIVKEGDTIREITVRNVEPDRLREIKSAVQWTLEKMYEKYQMQG